MRTDLIAQVKLKSPSYRGWIMYVMTFRLWLIYDIYFFFFYMA